MMDLPELRGGALQAFLGIEKIGFSDERRQGYQNLYDIWYARMNGGRRPPYMYDESGEWLETPMTARHTAISHVNFGLFDGIPDYRDELMRAALDKGLSDDDFVLEMAKLNDRFVPLLENQWVARVLKMKGHAACHHSGELTCPNCDAAAVSLYSAHNGGKVYEDLLHMDQAERWQALDNLGLQNSMKEFMAVNATSITKRADGSFEILTDALVTR